jgi:drug/metabolite transporter (DMT)-like permease
LLLPFVFLIRADWSLGQVGLLVLLGVVCTAGSHTLFIQSMKKIRAQTASIISSLEPVYGIILAYVFLREIPAFRTVAGGLVILAAVLLITFRARLFS